MTDNQDFFKTVGETAQEYDTTDDQGLTQTGAQDAEGHAVQEIESLCMNCHENGITRLLLTRIPYFREVVIMSFYCTHCGFKNSEIQPAGEIQEKGSKYTFKVEKKEDFNRQVIKSDYCAVKFVELDIEIPPKKGQLTTVEGLLSTISEDLKSDQLVRQHLNPELYGQINQVLDKIQDTIDAKEGILPITVTVDDPSGNSWIEFMPQDSSVKWSHHEYARTGEQNVLLGLLSADVLAQHEIQEKKREIQERQAKEDPKPISTGFLSDASEIENFTNEVQTFTATCPTCYKSCETHMKPVKIPHFKDVIIMNTSCEHCGYKSNEVKTGGAIPEKGQRTTLFVEDADDLTRDILKSETCALKVPELNLDLQTGTLGGRFTTVEGLLTQVLEELESRVFTETSDSMETETYKRWKDFFDNLRLAISGKLQFTVIMEDPLAASYIQNIYAPDPDPNMKIEEYERTEEQNEDLGINDMRTD